MSRFLAVVVVLFSILSVAPRVSAQSAASSATPSATPSAAASGALLTPEQARDALAVLNDPKRRAQVEDTLRAVAAANTLAAPAAASAPEPASSAAASAPVAASGVAAAFKSNSLVTQVSRQLAHWASMVGHETRRSMSTLLDIHSATLWWTAHTATPEGRTALWQTFWIVIASLVPAWAIEWGLLRLTLRPRTAIIQRANAAAAADANAERHDAELTPDEREQAQGEQISEALRHDGGHAPHLRLTHLAIGKRHAVRHWSLLRRVPAALLNAVLGTVPVIGFALCASLLMSILADDGSAAEEIASSLVDIYVICRAVLIVGNLFFAPYARGLRLWRVGDDTALFVRRWVRRIVAVVGVGSALAEAPLPLGLTLDAHAAIMKLVALIAHVMVAIVILQCRRPVARWLRETSAHSQTLAYLGNWLADIWAGVAIFFVLALWLIWALDVNNGFETLVHLGGVSLLVLVLARVIAIVSLGALAHVFRANQNDDTDDASVSRDGQSIVQRRAYRYYPMLQRSLSMLIGIVALLTLLDIWGIHLLRFLVANPIGHRLISALVTIAVAAAIAVIIWEATNILFERRLRKWTERGEFIRATRLRTLLPMLRSALLVAIALVVGLTGLSQIGVNTAPLLASASIFGVALGFGSQKLVQDFITGIFLLMENAMQVGDYVTVAGVSGTVEYLSIRTVRLRGSDGSLFTVPFSSVTTVNNVNRGIGNAAVRVSIAYGADVDRAIDTLKQIGASLREDPLFKDGILADFSFWGVDSVDGSAVTLAGQIQCRDTMRWPVQREFNRRILARFSEVGIEIANPLRNVMMPPRAARSDIEADAGTDTRGGADAHPGARIDASAGTHADADADADTTARGQTAGPRRTQP
ncbi:mechanosensitive ion channel domain-containing protein [Pararobbsia silviterrae]|uniref:Mechanosensitive ion channel protein n=1 Tax=Pararobbsia silviterrae TaxID=1792498 RepID=A0A494X2X5_9BURK|nr:mechanosensitive ion channel domain-containing protein [Pararobbsia silviterrae]RKP45047.1 mechanosensitive ion channel protein [Pararobbsia silviterrae]